MCILYIATKINLQEVGREGMNWIDLAQDRGQVAGACECGNVPSGSLKYGDFLDFLRNY